MGTKRNRNGSNKKFIWKGSDVYLDSDWCLFFVEGIFFFGTKITHMSLLLLLSTTTAAITQLCFLLSASNLQLRLIVTVTCWPLK